MTGRGHARKTNRQQKAAKPFRLTAPVNPAPFSNFPPAQSNASPVWPQTFGQQPAEQPKKRKRAEVSQWREYPRRSRAQVSYADAEDSDDSAFYESDDDGEGIVAHKKVKIDRPLPKRKIFPFLSLPRELRDLIYHFALGQPSTTIITETDNHHQPSSPSPTTSNIIHLCESQVRWRNVAQRTPYQTNHYVRGDGTTTTHAPTWGARPTCRVTHEPQPLATGLLRANRQVHAEAAAVLYGANAFAFACSATLHAFLVALLRWFGRRQHGKAWDRAAFALLAEGGVGVRRFGFEAGTRSRVGKREARRIHRMAWPWLEAVAREREEGVEGVLEVVATGVGAWGEEWRVGGEEWAEFRREFLRLMRDEGWEVEE
ncbi:hypothetical protein GTA08_BOTSDO11059 [Neofusicoccum parvum]|nr:hypothetical protein GTA08_BOTSDO11059 [Neofusicoccum parvum]